eukprot:jgi/Tetstr1/429800/TSEL_019667.t1
MTVLNQATGQLVELSVREAQKANVMYGRMWGKMRTSCSLVVRELGAVQDDLLDTRLVDRAEWLPLNGSTDE